MDTARLTQVVVDPMNPLAYKQEKETKFPGHRGNAVDRQLRFDARSLDNHRCDVCRHHGTHLGAMLCASGNFGLLLLGPGAVVNLEKRGSTRTSPLTRGGSMTCGISCTKSADDSWSRSRRNLGLMIREELLKENIDGEALIWAHNQLSPDQNSAR